MGRKVSGVDLTLLLLSAFLSGCNHVEKLSDNEKYVMQAFDSIEVHSMYRNSIDLYSLENLVLSRISGSTSHADVLRELEAGIKAIDPHNYILTAEKYRRMETGTDPTVISNPYPYRSEIIQDTYALITLEGFVGVDSTSSKNYSDSLQRIVLDLNAHRPRGWIIDLRRNSGGWVYPMLSGLGPLLGEGVKAYEISDRGIVGEFYFMKDTTDFLRLSDSAYILKDQLPIAVLVGEGTGSAGELLALAFRGNPKTILIGQPTAGFSTGLRGFFMPDSTQICVTNSILTDRTQKGDGGRISPHILALDSIEFFERAYEWIENHGNDNQ